MSTIKHQSENIEDADHGAEVSVDPNEAEDLGAVEDNALTEEEAAESRFDEEA